MNWDAENKAHWLEVMRGHQAADRLRQGAWLEDKEGPDGEFRGCMYGCAMQTNDRPLSKAAEAMGLPLWLVALTERIFEGLPASEAVLFPVRLLEAAPVDTDLRPVLYETHARRLGKLAAAHPAVADVLDSVAHLMREEAAGRATDRDWQRVREKVRHGSDTSSPATRLALRCARTAALTPFDSAGAVVLAGRAYYREEDFWAGEADTLIELLEGTGTAPVHTR